MQWLELTIQTTPQVIELVAARLTMLGFDSFILEDQAEFQDFLEHNRQYWDYVDEALAQAMEGLSQIRLFVADDPEAPAQLQLLKSELDALREQLRDMNPGPLLLRCKNVRDEDWENNWKQYYQPIPVGKRLLVVPQWLHPENPDGRLPVLLDPGISFGTGAHATTQLCMCELEAHLHGGERVIDLGSGSGILSITALVLGAGSAIGVDIDPKAETIARENAALNGFGAECFTACTGDVISDHSRMTALAEGGYDIVLANIVADVIIALAPVVPNFMREDSWFILSGILDGRCDEVRAAVEAAGLQVIHARRLEDWNCMACRLRGGRV